MVYDCISISPVIINSLSEYAKLGNEIAFSVRVCYDPGMCSLHLLFPNKDFHVQMDVLYYSGLIKTKHIHFICTSRHLKT